MPPQKYYAVMKGRKLGIFTTWAQCQAQVKGFRGAVFKSYPTRAEAEAAIKAFDAGEAPSIFAAASRSASKASSAGPSEIIQESICVDAACSGNPGNVEYQGVWTATKEPIFHKGPLAQGTNNLGEFLAIVHGLSYLQNQGLTIPIYTDSATAILWVKKREVRTTLARTSRNQEIFDLVDRALAWLQVNDYPNRILKWETSQWGEIPADFGRK
ncbi:MULTISPECIES: viroplasmin family protein [unclassified Leptolyngbya]|uniref:ribonuclease H1 domain-containing protein n=1 Tax=unclassified Leptolyngbya TaxID=2650499 RepID=UPI001681C349|nr:MULTISPECIES: viroplasmin family protein [unclassified Leptolyngbya]MBD1913740.1 viroplasmin family protein [Leptolyngbya sp. FACHB-8]MBD2153224.1 viroplasmin family protein [Leptolyngbya sp. FACHB-16]